MKRLVLATSVLLSFMTSSALAAGQIHLAVGDCGGPAVVNNACDSNTGSIVLVVSTVSPVASNQVIGFEAEIDLSQSSTLSPWMRWDAAGCRSGRLLSDADFVITGTACNDVFAGQASSGIGIFYPDPRAALIANNSEELDVFAAVDSNFPMTVDNTTENSLFHIVILNAGTVGSPCAGCLTPTSFYINQLIISQEPGLSDIFFRGDGIGQGVSYNGGNISTPNRSTSWGAIKALYR